MKERPILFSGEMVRAILDGRKTMTRRILNPQPAENYIPLGSGYVGANRYWTTFDDPSNDDAALMTARCPYGKPGDRLWVTETFYAWGRWVTRFNAAKGRDEWHFIDLTEESGKRYQYDQPECFQKQQRGGVLSTWWKRPAIFMWRKASRITLEITNIRVERLQAISEADAMAEGVPVGQRATVPGGKHANCVNCGQHRNQHVGQVRGCFGGTGDIFSTNTYRGGFAFLWDQINGKRASWASSPWVWVIEFKRVEGER